LNVIQVENISKLYRLGQVGTGSIFHDVNRWWHGVRGKEDPYMRVGQENDRTKKGDGDYVWALKDINFDVAQGEVLGIIGRNGAGKSTLLKILSRTTAPTTGSIKVKGRIASLLEVGTGFHPELSGRDNIFMNGTLLGMTRAEIKSKFDEIVEFAGVARYLDTPVKRYSSGMYVRLAFAVAAHLESEILIVDEVLAVGDAEFQKKCLGKMKDVSEKQGRTVLFVSHNMQAIANLSTKLITMHNGVTRNFPNPIEGIEEFTSTINLAMDSNSKTGFLNEVESNDFIKISSLYLTDENGINKSTFYNNERVCLNLECEIIKIDPLLVIGLGLYNSEGVNIFWSINLESAEPIQLRLGFQKIQMLIPSNFLNHGKYSIELIVALHNSKWIYRPHDNAPVLYFSLIDQLPTNSVWSDKRQGCLVSNVEYKKIDNWEQ
jgi:lipopolysaccharide transport system ATP-binding protein